jgi:hypothetical protein
LFSNHTAPFILEPISAALRNPGSSTVVEPFGGRWFSQSVGTAIWRNPHPRAHNDLFIVVFVDVVAVAAFVVVVFVVVVVVVAAAAVAVVVVDAVVVVVVVVVVDAAVVVVVNDVHKYTYKGPFTQKTQVSNFAHFFVYVPTWVTLKRWLQQ